MQSDAPLYPRPALLFAAIILGIVSTTLLSAAEGLLPRSALPGVRSIDTIERYEMPWFDVEALKAGDAERERSGVPVAPRIGKVLEVEYTLDNSGTWEVLEDGSRLWRFGFPPPEP